MRQMISFVALLACTALLSGCCEEESAQSPYKEPGIPTQEVVSNANGEQAAGDNAEQPGQDSNTDDGAAQGAADEQGSGDGAAADEQGAPGGDEQGESSQEAGDEQEVVVNENRAVEGEDRNAEKLEAMAKLIDADPEQGWEVDAADFKGRTLVVAVQEEKAGALPSAQIAIVADGNVVSRTDQINGLFKGDAQVMAAFNDCKMWSGDLTRPIELGDQGAMALSFWCDKGSEDQPERLQLVTVLGADGELKDVNQLKPLWSGQGGSMSVNSDDGCALTGTAQFKGLDAQTLERRVVFTASPMGGEEEVIDYEETLAKEADEAAAEGDGDGSAESSDAAKKDARPTCSTPDEVVDKISLNG